VSGRLATDTALAGETPGDVDGVLAFGVGVFGVGVFFVVLDFVVYRRMEGGSGNSLNLQFIRISSPGWIVRTAWTYWVIVSMSK
jgi:hypothetical protein